MLARSIAVLLPALTCPGSAAAQESLHLFELETNPSHHYGTTVEGVGDVDADGFDDVAVAAYRAVSGRGRVDVHSGRTGALIHQIVGSHNHDWLGYRIQAMGDVDGDGRADFAIASPAYDASGVNAGAVEVYSGASGTVLHRIDPPPPHARLFGRTMGACGDIDGDGVLDLIIGDASSQLVRARVYSGASGGLLFTLSDPGGSNFSGAEVDGAGDVDGDGVEDFVYGRPDFQGHGQNIGVGIVHLVSGATGAQLYEVQAPHGTVDFGQSVSGVGDVDGDGLDDIVVGAPGTLAGTPATPLGAAFVLSGLDGSIMQTLTSGASSLQFGHFVRGAGDVDGDQVPDLLVATRDGELRRVVSGATGALIFEVTATPTTFDLVQPLSDAGDVNGDGYADVVFGTGPSIITGSAEVFGRSRLEGTPYCLGRPNSTGDRGRLTADSPSGFMVAANDVRLTVTSLPPQALGYFLVSQAGGIVPGAGGGSGTLCLAGSVFGRYAGNVLDSGATGIVQFDPDATSIPFASAAGSGVTSAMAGDTFNFQLWYRDTQASGAATSNMSDALAVTYR